MPQTTTDGLASELDKIASTCTTHNIAIFYGELEEGVQESLLANWKDPTAESLPMYLEALVKAASGFLILDIERYQEDSDESIQQLIKDYKESLNENQREAYDAALTELNRHEGEVISYTLSILHQGVWYHYQRDADWRVHYDTFTDAYESIGGDNIDEEVRDKDHLTDEERELVQRLIHEPAYQKSNRYSERLQIAREWLHRQGITDKNRLHVMATEAYERYNWEVLPQLEVERRKLVQELKSQGCTKVEVKSRLGLSDSQLNKYWY